MATQTRRRQASRFRSSVIALVLVTAGAGCSLVADPLTEPVPVAALTEQAATMSPAAWDTDPPDGWPSTVPAPTFLDGSAYTVGNQRTGDRRMTIDTSSSLDTDAVAAYIALLLDVGFVPDLRSATHGWFVRDDVEWVALQNRDLTDFMVEGSSANPRSFVVMWTNNPVGVGYCRIVEVGGETCRE